MLPYLVVLAAAIYSVWPVAQKPATAFLGGGDVGIITWYLIRNIQKIPGNLANIFDGNIFFPLKNTRGYGVMMVPSALLAYWPAKLLGTHVAAYNAALILGQVGVVTVLYLWITEMTGDRRAGTAGAILFGLSQVRFLFVVHIHTWTMQWTLLALWMAWRYRSRGLPRYIYAVGILMAVQAWESVYQVYWIALGVGVMWWEVRREAWGHWRHLLASGAVVLVLAWPVMATYAHVGRDYGYTGSVRESAHFSLSLDEFWTSVLSPGLYLVFGVVLWRWRQEGWRGFGGWKWALALGAAGAILALGPVLKWQGKTVKVGGAFVPLPYGVLYYALPGLSALRSVHRYVWLMGLAMAILAVARVGRSGRRGWAGMAALVLVGAAGGTRLTAAADFPRPENYPAVYRWLVDQPGEAVLEYPVYFWGDPRHELEMYRMVYSLEHKKSLVGGASGFMPRERGDLLGKISVEYPSLELNQRLFEMGVDYVVVHKREASREKAEELERREDLKKVWDDGSSAVYRLTP